VADAEDLIANVRLPEAHVPLCLRGDLLAELADLERQLDEANGRDQADSLAAGGAARRIAERMETVHAEIREHTHVFRFRALPRHVFRQLQDEHPPREGNAVDNAIGANYDTFQAPLIAACCLDPVLTAEQADAMVDVMSEAQTVELFGAALTLNRTKADLPKFETASAILARLEPRSRRHEPGGSAANGSSGGSLAG
jgi:hypothetical protein